MPHNDPSVNCEHSWRWRRKRNAGAFIPSAFPDPREGMRRALEAARNAR